VLAEALTERPTMIATTVLTLIVIMAIAMRMPTSWARESVHTGGADGRRMDSAGGRRCASASEGVRVGGGAGRSLDATSDDPGSALGGTD
jgi:hypothetical protein